MPLSTTRNKLTRHPTQYISPGLLMNTNTLDGFKKLDHTQLLRSAGEKIWTDIQDLSILEEPSRLTSFLLISFADLKKYKFYYWVAFPAITHSVRETAPATTISAEFHERFATALQSYQGANASCQWPFFLIREEADGTVVLGQLSQYKDFWSKGERRKLGFIDPCSVKGVPGWPLRNLVVLLARLDLVEVDVLCYRDHTTGRAPTSMWLHCAIDPLNRELGNVVGWERNPNNSAGPVMTDLGALLDPHKLADQAVDLNLKLMKWRVAPSLDLDSIQHNKCLLLGAGTLGSYIARGLLGWGVRKITFVDSGKVSYSNPVRQPLYEFEDCLEGGLPKAETAARMLKKIYPSVDSQGYQLEIPMAGHSLAANASKQQEDYDTLVRLIEEHDTVFLLLDSREARWLPTVIACALGKLVINVALGFDTFVVMRHGVADPAEEDARPQLGCYFCNDVVAPVDSMSGQTLDQMCTVTRPGIAMISSGMAVEMFASIQQHPLRGRAPAWKPDSTEQEDSNAVLSRLPHQLRGFLDRFDVMKIWGPAYSSCAACSEPIVGAWKQDGWKFVSRVLEDSSIIPELCGLSELERKTQEIAVDWTSEDDELN